MPDLGLDTASDDASVALLEGDRVLAERRWRIATTASRELLAAIEAVLNEAGITREALASVAVDVGPGGYGSLRAGVATAQGLALGLGIPLAGVGRLEADAFPHLRPGETVVAVHAAGRDAVAWAAYRGGEPRDSARGAPPEVVIAPRIDTPEQCARLAPAGARWCGELIPPLQAALHAARDATGRSGDTDRTGAGRSAADVVRLARLRGAYGDPAEVDVVYLRPPSIGARAS